MSWEKTTIGEHCTVTSSKRFHLSERSSYGIPFYCSKEIIQKHRGEEITSCDYIKESFYNKIIEKFGVPNTNDLLITTRGTLGIPYLYKKNDKFYFADGNLTWLKSFKCTLSPKYLYYWFLSDEGHHKILSISKGTAQKAIPIIGIKNLEIFLPDIVTQNHIASILSAYDDLIENNQKQIKLLEEAAQRLYKEWFVDLRFPGWENAKIVDGVPEGWERLPLPQIADIQYGFAFDGSLFNSSGYGTPIVRIRNIPDAETSDFTSEEASSEYLINNGDIIVGMDGEFHINSWAGGQAYLVQRTCCIRPKIEKMRGWLLYSIHEPIKYFEKTIVGATVAHLGKKHLDSITLLVPTEELYAPFISIFNKRQILMEENIKLREARDKLIYILMDKRV